MVSGAFTLASLRYPSRCAKGLVGGGGGDGLVVTGW
jgi:hypothetical protein